MSLQIETQSFQFNSTVTGLSSARFNSVSAVSLSGTHYGNGSNLTGLYQGSDLKALSGNWQSTYGTVSSLSANWNSAYNVATAYQTASGSFITAVSGTANQINASKSGSTVTLSLPQSAVFPGDVNIIGNLTIAGSATYINTKNLVVGDNIIYFNDNNYESNVLDVGIVSHFTQAPLGYNHTGLVRRAGGGVPGIWTLFSGLTTEPISAANLDWNDKNIVIDSLSANLIGNVTGNADTVTNGVYTNGSYSNPSWITSLADTKITGPNRNNWDSTYTTVNSNSANWNSAYNISTNYQSTSSSFATNTLLQSTSALLTPLTLTNSLTGQLVLNTTLNSLSGNWQSTYGTVSSLSANWNSAYTSLSNYLPLSGGTLTGGLSAPALSSSYLFGTGTETVLSDGLGTNDLGNGNNTLSLNFSGGVFVGGNGVLTTPGATITSLTATNITVTNTTTNTLSTQTLTATNITANSVPVYSYLTNDSTAIGPAITNYGLTTFNLVANGVYELLYDLYYTKNTAGTVLYSLSSNNTFGFVNAEVVQTINTGVTTFSAPTKAYLIGATGPVAAFANATASLTTGVNHNACIRYIIKAGSLGNSVFLATTESSTTITPKQGSFAKLTRIA